MLVYYTVAHNGRHLFNTEEVSIFSDNESPDMERHLVANFPKAAGYVITKMIRSDLILTQALEQ